MNITDILQQHGVPTRSAGQDKHARAGWIQVVCPFCDDGRRKFHCGLSLRSSAANCYQCGPKHANQVLHALGIDVPDIAYERHARPLRKRKKLKLPVGVAELMPAHEKYIRSRGFDPKAISDVWGVQGIGPLGMHAWSLYVPIRERDKAAISWTTRAIGRNGRRYLNCPVEDEALPAKSVLYGAELAKSSVVIVEGPTDAWNVGPGAVATMGLQYTDDQVALAAQYGVRAIMFDHSRPARKQARKLYERLSAFRGKTLLLEIDADDPGEADAKEIASIRRCVFGE